MSMLCTGELKTGRGTLGVVSQNEFPVTCWQHSCYLGPGCGWPSSQPGHVTCLCSAYCLPGHAVLFCKAASQPLLVHEIIPPQVQDFALAIVELHVVPVSLFLQPAEVPWDGSSAFQHIDFSPNLVSSTR